MDGFKFEEISASDLSGDGQAIFDLLKQALLPEGKEHAESSKIANTIQQHFESLESAERVESVAWELWMVLAQIVHVIPLRSVRTVAAAVTHLRKNGGLIGGQKLESTRKWEDLPHLDVVLRDNWYDPSEIEADGTDENMWKWYRFNVFTAQITTAEFSPWLTFPIWNLRDALEEPEVKGVAMGTRLWIAYEWIEACGGLIFADMTSSEELDEETNRAIRTGQLCPEGVSPRSIERWDFWRRRILETAEKFDELELRISSNAGVVGKEMWQDRAALVAGRMDMNQKSIRKSG